MANFFIIKGIQNKSESDFLIYKYINKDNMFGIIHSGKTVG